MESNFADELRDPLDDISRNVKKLPPRIGVRAGVEFITSVTAKKTSTVLGRHCDQLS